jgi:hypothetical protein
VLLFWVFGSSVDGGIAMLLEIRMQLLGTFSHFDFIFFRIGGHSWRFGECVSCSLSKDFNISNSIIDNVIILEPIARETFPTALNVPFLHYSKNPFFEMDVTKKATRASKKTQDRRHVTS